MYKYFLKRIIDILLAVIALIILSPLLIPVCIGLLLTGEHYIFYFQKRIGYKNRYFDIWKFATMLKASPNLAGGLQTTKNDPRLMPMGGFLRKTKINELPQLVNILTGDMSIIGPRPLVDKTFAPYPEHVKAVIYNVKPGLTGIGSIVFRDEEDFEGAKRRSGEAAKRRWGDGAMGRNGDGAKRSLSVVETTRGNLNSGIFK